jgi:hypothetical protein
MLLALYFRIGGIEPHCPSLKLVLTAQAAVADQAGRSKLGERPLSVPMHWLA